VLDIPKIGNRQRARVAAARLPGSRAGQLVRDRGRASDRVTTMMTDKGIDTGDILLQRETSTCRRNRGRTAYGGFRSSALIY
jgi:hypothetical protein